MKRAATAVALVVLGGIAAAGCSDDPSSGESGPSTTAGAAAPASAATTADQAAKPTPPAPTPAVVAPSRCRAVSAAALAEIADGLEAGPKRLSHGFAVRSTDYARVFMIAARFRVNGVDGYQVGVWARNGSPRGPGLILSVNGFAKEFSVWPDGGSTDARISALDDGVTEAKECATRGRT